ncbi:MAG: Uma2 family endonuclease [Chloroflexia bacterium]|nr:Uma2 family endonuclease [Chloroflexia bacterium]
MYRALHEHVVRDDLGLVFLSGLGYVLGRGPDSVRMTHASFIPWECVPEEGVPDWFWEGAPSLAVEIVAPEDRAIELHEKVGQFLKAGVEQVWVLWPRWREVTVRAPDGMGRELGPDDELGGGELLPDFRVRVADLFDLPERRLREG